LTGSYSPPVGSGFLAASTASRRRASRKAASSARRCSSVLRGGWAESAEALSARSAVSCFTWAYRLQAAAQHGIQGQSVQITATAVANDNGLILANESVTINGSGQLNNTGGTISAGRALRIIDAAGGSLENNRLAIANTGGTLIAGESLQINAGRLSTDGKLHSNGDFDLRLNTSIANTGELVAGRNLTVVTNGSFTNSGTLSAANALNVSATDINNTSTGEITAMSTTLNAAEQITNRGLINGDDTVLKAETIANIGTGRIYGTRLGLQADTVYNTDESTAASIGRRRRTGFHFTPWNASWYVASTEAEQAVDSGQSAVIAARERLDIGANEVQKQLACRRWLAPAGSGIVAVCHFLCRDPYPGGTSRSRSEKRSGCSGPKISGCARLPAVSDAARQRSQGS
jgi:adhesin HecA-like repeat protein